MATFAIHPPTGGIQNVSGFQTQAPYSCVESTNFWPVDVRDGRMLTATRPPMAEDEAFPEFPVNMFMQLNVPQPTAFAAANGILYKRSSAGVWSNAAASTVGVSTGRPVFASPFFRQILIANTGIPLHYDNDTGLLVELVATSGFVPEDCRLTMNFQGSAWLGGSPTDEVGPHVFAACAFDDIHDWDFSGDTETSAYISTGEDRGLITQPLSAMIALTTDQAVLGCEEELWTMSGHPRRGGRFDRVSNQSGILGQNAWCNTPKGFFFMAHDGLMGVARNSYGNLDVVPVSKSKIPSELLGIPFDALQPTVCMAYCSRWDCIYITVRDSERPQQWMYFLQTGGFTKMRLPESPLVMSAFETLVTDDASGVLFGGNALRRFDRTATESITSSQIIGPVRTSSNTMDCSIITRASALFAAGTTDDDASVEIYTGGTGNAAVVRAQSRTPQYRYKTTVGRIRRNNRNLYPHLRGCAATLRIDQTESTGRVIFEDFVGELEKGGINMDSGLTAPVVTPPTAPTIEIAQD